jgi:hypothetical protein
MAQPNTSESAAPQVQCPKCPSTPPCVLAKAKHPCTLAYPPVARCKTQKQVSKPVGTRQTVTKNKANDHVLNGTFVHNLMQWEEYKRKLAELDPHFEVSKDPRLVHQVKHSVCGGWFVMAAPYDKEHFKKHIASCSYSTDSGGMKSLESFGVIVLSARTLSLSYRQGHCPCHHLLHLIFSSSFSCFKGFFSFFNLEYWFPSMPRPYREG